MKNAKQPTDLEALGLTHQQIEDYTKALKAFAAVANPAQQRLSQAMQQHDQNLLRVYQQAIAPAIRRVATGNGRAVIMTPNGSMIYTDPRPI